MITEEKWNKIVKTSAYNNVTIVIEVSDLKGLNVETSFISAKIVGDSCKAVDDGENQEIDIETFNELFLKICYVTC